MIAAQRPEMRFVPPKSEEQQARAALFRGRERLVQQRTELLSALRGLLYEFEHVVPRGIRHLTGIEAIVEDPSAPLPDLVRAECRNVLRQIS